MNERMIKIRIHFWEMTDAIANADNATDFITKVF